jgi:hypothetical protein
MCNPHWRIAEERVIEPDVPATALAHGSCKMKRRFIVLAVGLLGFDPPLAQAADPLSDTELSKEADNPVTRQITLPLQYEADFDEGAGHQTKQIFELDQAVVPFRLNDDWALITRTKLPFEDVPSKKVHESWTSGLGNGYTTFFLSPERGQGFYWGAGPLLYYPASSPGVQKWGTGPSIGFVRKDESPWEFGAVVNNIWSIGGPPLSSERTNELTLNPFVSYHFDDGWSVGSSPNITANWLESGGKWTLPVGSSIGKVVRLNEQPVKFSFAAYYNAIRPQADNATWLIQATMTFLFP